MQDRKQNELSLGKGPRISPRDLFVLISTCCCWGSRTPAPVRGTYLPTYLSALLYSALQSTLLYYTMNIPTRRGGGRGRGPAQPGVAAGARVFV